MINAYSLEPEGEKWYLPTYSYTTLHRRKGKKDSFRLTNKCFYLAMDALCTKGFF